uniref:Uncharacterized protein n=1 Tax=Lepeophtheirus salmonis TaxID=72036 RepID=A0A0K2VB62_LEPSM
MMVNILMFRHGPNLYMKQDPLMHPQIQKPILFQDHVHHYHIVLIVVRFSRICSHWELNIHIFQQRLEVLDLLAVFSLECYETNPMNTALMIECFRPSWMSFVQLTCARIIVKSKLGTSIWVFLRTFWGWMV